MFDVAAALPRVACTLFEFVGGMSATADSVTRFLVGNLLAVALAFGRRATTSSRVRRDK